MGLFSLFGLLSYYVCIVIGLVWCGIVIVCGLFIAPKSTITICAICIYMIHKRRVIRSVLYWYYAYCFTRILDDPFASPPHTLALRSLALLLYSISCRLFQNCNRLVYGGDPAVVLKHVVTLQHDFLRTPLTLHSVFGPHTHPSAASVRNSADGFISSVALSSGFKLLSIQASKLDIQQGLDVWHQHVTPRDEHIAPRADDLFPYHLIKLVNVDYYIDINKILALGQPVIMFTFTPESPADVQPDYSYSFINPTTIQMHVTGGAQYEHQLWDYDVDMVVYDDCINRIRYRVERRSIAKHWSLILLLPTEFNLSEGEASYGFDRVDLKCVSTTLLSVVPIELPAAIMRRVVDGVMCYRVAEYGGVNTVDFPESCVATLAQRHKAKPLTIHDVNTIVPMYIKDVKVSAYASTMAYGLLPISNQTPLRVYTTPAYTIVTDGLDPAISIVGRYIGNSVYSNSYAPTKSLSNDEWCIRTRLADLTNVTRIPSTYLRYVREFISHVSSELVPADHQYVVDHQTRPQQRARNAWVSWIPAYWLIHVIIKSFQKGEFYMEVKDPRNISTLPPSHLYDYSRFTLPLADHCKRFMWYGFGKLPVDIAERINSIANTSSSIIETDFSRFDGTHGVALYAIERAILFNCFPQYQSELLHLHDSMMNARALTNQGLIYEIAGSRLSGCADTSIMNTLCNALISYVTLRLNHSSTAAFGKLGLYGGDDGLTPDVEPEVFVMVAKRFGLKLKASPRPSHAPIGFLGRIYLRPRTSLFSLADPLRLLPRLFVTVDMTTPKLVVLYNKLLGYYITDKANPIIALLYHRFIGLYGVKTIFQDLQPYAARNDTWPINDLGVDVVREFICSRLLITFDDLDSFLVKIASAFDLFNLPTITETPVDIPEAVVVGELPIKGQRRNNNTITPAQMSRRARFRNERVKRVPVFNREFNRVFDAGPNYHNYDRRVVVLPDQQRANRGNWRNNVARQP